MSSTPEWIRSSIRGSDLLQQTIISRGRDRIYRVDGSIDPGYFQQDNAALS